MANARKKGKRRANFWLTEAEIGVLKDFAEVEGVTQTDAMRILLIYAAKKAAKAKTNEKGKNK